MKNIYAFLLLCFTVGFLNAQTPFERVYNTLNLKCQNGSCHSAFATDASAALRFDTTASAVHSNLFNVPSSFQSSVDKFEKLVKPQHPYTSFLLRKIAGAAFDTDLAIDTATEGALMTDINGNPLTNKEIEFIRQWIMFGAKKTYGNNEAQPNWQYVSDYYDNPAHGFLPKPPKPAAGEGIQLRMGPIFLPKSGSMQEQEWLQQAEVNFPFLAEVYKIEGYMNQQSHHFLLFKYDNVAAATNSNAPDADNMSLVSITNFNTSFDGDKSLTAGWQQDDEFTLPEGTALMWDQKTILDMNFHMKNYNATSVLPCDFYFNVMFRPRNPQTIPMLTKLVNNPTFYLPNNTTTTLTYDDEANNDAPHIRYIWNIAGHTHEWGTGFDVYQRDTTGQLGAKLYDGTSVNAYGNSYYTSGTFGYWDYHHAPIVYFPDLIPVHYGKRNGKKSGLVSKATYYVTNKPLGVTFSFQTTGEMQLFYYMYTTQPLPADTVSSINDDTKGGIYFQVLPNPMNGENGKLVYTLDKAAKVQASIIDVAGKVIAELSPEYQKDGVHEMSLSNNSRLAAGIYFVKLSINEAVYTKKFIVTE